MRPGLLKGEWEQGVYTLAPLPWVTLLLSFCALMSLLPPLSPLPRPPTQVPTQVIPPPSICSPLHHLLILRWAPAHTMPKTASTNKGP